MKSVVKVRVRERIAKFEERYGDSSDVTSVENHDSKVKTTITELESLIKQRLSSSPKKANRVSNNKIQFKGGGDTRSINNLTLPKCQNILLERGSLKNNQIHKPKLVNVGPKEDSKMSASIVERLREYNLLSGGGRKPDSHEASGSKSAVNPKGQNCSLKKVCLKKKSTPKPKNS